MRRLVVFLLLLTLITTPAHAQVDFDIQLTVTGGTDLLPPSTPTLTTVDPVASTQIDLTWTAATDTVAVGGYVVFRDGSDIATTTLLNYSDSGLVASTTYSYTVRAFDTSFNYSSSSNALATTTLAVPVVPPTPTSTISTQTQGTASRVVLDELFITEGVSTTSLDLTTALPARIEVRWGRTAAYELGYVTSNLYLRDHSILITDLEPGTRYEYEIIGYNARDRQTVLKSGSFTTLSYKVAVSPTNVSQFVAIQNGEDVDLSWRLPVGEDIAQVRVVRSHLGFPEFPNDGAIAYQGDGESVKDRGVLGQFSPVYYTAFVYDQQGNISSGAVAMVYRSGSASDNAESADQSSSRETIKVPELVPEATSTIDKKRVTIEMKMPEPREVYLMQNGKRYVFGDNDIKLDYSQNFTVLVPYAAVAGNLKSIIVTVLNPTNTRQAQSFLLRLNPDRSAYEATVGALGVVGRSQAKLEIYDYQAFVVATYQVPISFVEVEEETGQSDKPIFPDLLFEHAPWLFGGIIILIIFIIILFYLIRLKRNG